MSCRDWQPPRPQTVFVCCPECQTEYPRDVIAAVGPSKCGSCGETFVLRPRVGVVRLEPPTVTAPPARRPPVPAPVELTPQRFIRAADAHGSVSTSVRTSQTEKAEWQKAADASGMTTNGWMRRALSEALALERSSAAHPDHKPASRATPETKESR